MIDCLPQGICSWNYVLSGDGWQASVRMERMREQGTIEINGREFTIRKHGFASGTWSLESEGQIVLTARKKNPFTRTFMISGDDADAELRADSVFSRSMWLTGRGIDCRIQPRHPFTRRATIEGPCPDDLLTCFAFWLTVLSWRRTRRRASNSTGA